MFADAMWSGIGTTLTVAVSVLFFSEVLTWTKALSIACIIVGVFGLNA